MSQFTQYSGFRNDYSKTLNNDFKSLDYNQARNLYYSFNPLQSAYDYISTAEHKVDETTQNEIIKMANEYKENLGAYYKELFDKENNSIESQAKQQRAIGLNPDLNGVNFSPSASQDFQRSDISEGRDSRSFGIVDNILKGIATASEVTNSVSGFSNNLQQKRINNYKEAGLLADTLNKYNDLGIEDISNLGLSRRAAKNIKSGISDLSPDLVNSANLVRQSKYITALLNKDKLSEEKRILPLINEINELDLKNQKTYFENVDSRLKALRENSENKYKNEKASFDSEELSHRDPSHQSKMDSLAEEQGALNLGNITADINLKNSQSGYVSEQTSSKSNENFEYSEFVIIRDELVKYNEQTIKDLEGILEKHYKPVNFFGKPKKLSSVDLDNKLSITNQIQALRQQNVDLYRAKSLNDIDYRLPIKSYQTKTNFSTPFGSLSTTNPPVYLPNKYD